MRLLKSLQKADYFQSTPPRLTIELPNKVDEPTQRYLAKYKWPPSDHPIRGSANQLNLRHRILQPGMNPEENSVRFLESFWPSNAATSHLLVLSPQVEMSPLFFQYLFYAILEYKHSVQWTNEHQIMGISLDMPSTYLNDSTPFSPPKSKKASSNTEDTTSFLWQAPNSAATLYFGDKWTELHSFVGHSLQSQHKLPTPTTLNAKQVSKTYPSWLEHILHLARTRGYFILYTNLARDTALATVHNELYQPPEEFSNEEEGNPDYKPGSEMDWTADPAHHLSLQHREKPLAQSSLLKVLPAEGKLPGSGDMPLLSWDGKLVTRSELDAGAAKYSQVFRREIGGCSTADQHQERVEGSAEDLFCFDAETG
jgi:hypothetical protein